MEVLPDIIDMERRICRLEQRLDREAPVSRLPAFHPAWPFLLGLMAIALGYFGVGYPSHYYQVLFSLLLLLLLYHRGSLLLTEGRWKWPLVLVNFLLFCLLFQFLIGGGISHPFDWVRIPVIAKVLPAGDKPWYSVGMSDYAVQWQAMPKLAEWSIDITRVQTFLFLAVLAGALFRLESFTSITALALLLVSLPVYLRFNWDWIVPFIIAGSVSIYLQAEYRSGRGRSPRDTDS
jgi:hypothetical protein